MDNYTEITSIIKIFKKQLREKKLRPLIVQWMATYECNLNCGHCGSAAGVSREDELSTSETLRIIDELHKLGCKYLHISGGEPFVRKDLFEIIRYARKKNIEVGVVTNGSLFGKFYNKLKKVKLYAVSISIDGYRKMHDKKRGMNGLYKQCLQSILLCNHLRIPIIQVATVLDDENVSDLDKITMEIFKYGATKHRIQLLIPEGRAKGKDVSAITIKKAFMNILRMRERGYNVFIGDSFGFVGNLERKLRSYIFFCGCGWSTFTIMPNGDIMGCPAFDYLYLKEGNVREKKLKDIWWHGFKKFREFNFNKLPDKCRECLYLEICRGGCWTQRINGGRFCNLDLIKEIYNSIKSKEVDYVSN